MSDQYYEGWIHVKFRARDEEHAESELVGQVEHLNYVGKTIIEDSGYEATVEEGPYSLSGADVLKPD